MTKDKFKQFGISEDDFNTLLIKQGYRCAICGETNNGRSLAIDHDHVTGEVRGLLCTKCNMGLGCFDDKGSRLAKAIEYLNQETMTHPLCKKFFLTPQKQNGWQGQLLEFLGNGLFIAQLYSWITGYETNQVVVNLADMKNWQFYTIHRDWLRAGEAVQKNWAMPD